MRQILFLKIFVLLIFLSSCSPSISTISSTAKTVDVGSTGVYHMPVIADLNVSDEKVKGEVKTSSYEVDLNEVKREAVYIALKEVNGDVLVEPKYEIKTVGRSKTITVSGYPATYKNFRNASSEELPFLKLEGGSKIHTTEVKEKEEEPKIGQAVLLSVLGIGLTVGILSIL